MLPMVSLTLTVFSMIPICSITSSRVLHEANHKVATSLKITFQAWTCLQSAWTLSFWPYETAAIWLQPRRGLRRVNWAALWNGLWDGWCSSFGIPHSLVRYETGHDEDWFLYQNPQLQDQSQSSRWIGSKSWSSDQVKSSIMLHWISEIQTLTSQAPRRCNCVV